MLCHLFWSGKSDGCDLLHGDFMLGLNRKRGKRDTTVRYDFRTSLAARLGRRAMVADELAEEKWVYLPSWL
jgi:hypothetical protein